MEEVVIEGVLVAYVHLRSKELYNGNESVAGSEEHDLATRLPEDMHAYLPEGCLSLETALHRFAFGLQLFNGLRVLSDRLQLT